MTQPTPEVGAKIRVTRTHASGTTQVLEGIVHDLPRARPYTLPKAILTCGSGVWLEEPSGSMWDTTIEVLAPPCPPEPRNGRSGQALTDGDTVWLRSAHGWFDGFDADSRVITWEQLHARRPNVRMLVEEPMLRQLETVSDAARAWVERIQDDARNWGDEEDHLLISAAVALGAKYAPKVTS